jgi:hypothetical protein
VSEDEERPPARKEAAYDEHVAPLMKQVIALCKLHRINMAAQFALDLSDEGNVLYCTTVLHNVDPECGESIERMRKLREVMYPRATVLAFTIFGGAK